jgi:hypothetical protein
LILGEKNVHLFLVTIPLTQDGCFLRFYDKFGPEGPFPEGKLVFVPKNTALIYPGGTVHGGAFRTFPCGNCRLQLEVYMIPKESQFSVESYRQRHYVGIPEDHPKYYRLDDQCQQYYTDKFRCNKLDWLVRQLGH